MCSMIDSMRLEQHQLVRWYRIFHRINFYYFTAKIAQAPTTANLKIAPKVLMPRENSASCIVAVMQTEAKHV